MEKDKVGNLRVEYHHKEKRIYLSRCDNPGYGNVKEVDKLIRMFIGNGFKVYILQPVIYRGVDTLNLV